MNPRTEKPETIHVNKCKVSEHIKRQFLKFLEKRGKPLDTDKGSEMKMESNFLK